MLVIEPIGTRQSLMLNQTESELACHGLGALGAELLMLLV